MAPPPKTPKTPKPPAILERFTDSMDIETCTVSDTFDKAKLRNDGQYVKDACLENNIFKPIPDYEVITFLDHLSGEKTVVEFSDKNNVTWYANGFQWRPTSSGEIFNTYDFMIAVGKDLQEKFPAGSLVKIAYNGKTVIAKVVDRKPESENASPELKNSSVDLSKAVAFELGGYELLQKGIVHPITIERVQLACSTSYHDVSKIANPVGLCKDSNIFLSLRTGFFKFATRGKASPNPSPNDYKATVEFYFKVIPVINAYISTISAEYFTGDGSHPPMPQFVIVQQSVPRIVRQWNPKKKKNEKIFYTDTRFLLDIRVNGFADEEEAQLFIKIMKERFKNLDIVMRNEPWPLITEDSKMPKIQIPNPYHKKDPTSFEEVPASTKKNPKKPGKK